VEKDRCKENLKELRDERSKNDELKSVIEFSLDQRINEIQNTKIEFLD
jgi:hypothetical protein